MGSKEFFQWYYEAMPNREWIKLKYLAFITMGQSPLSEDCNSEGIGYPFLQGNADFGEVSPNARVFCEKPSKICSENSILISVRAPVGAQNIANQVYAIGRGLCAVKVGPKLLQKYLWYLLYLSKSELEINSTGTTFEAVSVSDVANMMIIVPHLNQQVKIAAFLDYKTSQIDNLIKEKERLLKLLEEKRIALITQAVTKGLNPNVKMKPSGVDWLGDIPQHWDVKRLKRVVNIVNDKIETDELSLPYVGLENIESKTGKYMPNENFSPEGIANKFLISDVLFGKLRPYLAKVYHANFIGCCTTEALVIRSGRTINSKFLSYYLLTDAVIDIINGSTFGSKMPRANWEFIGNMMIAIPPYDEQRYIAKEIETEINKIVFFETHVSEAIGKLKEYRISLITAAVTGKIDVRNFSREKEYEEVH